MSLCAAKAASAQEAPKLDRLEVALWPEYDRAAVLVVYRMTLSASVALPTTVGVPIPADVARPHAVAKRVAGQLYNLEHERVVDGDTATVNIKTDARDIQLEYYAPMTMNEAEREVNFAWPGGLEIKQFAYEVQVPAGASDFVLTPAHTSEAARTGGLKHYMAQLGPLALADKASIEITYQNTSGAMSVNHSKHTQPNQVAAPNPGGFPMQQPGAPKAESKSGMPWWIYAACLALLLGLGVALLSKKKKKS